MTVTRDGSYRIYNHWSCASEKLLLRASSCVWKVKENTGGRWLKENNYLTIIERNSQ